MESLSPKKAGLSPKKADSTPKKAASTPKKAASTPKKAISTPKKAVSTPKKAVSTPKKAGSTPKKAGSTPKKAGSTPKKAGSTPKKAVSTPKKAVSTPKKASLSLKKAGSSSKKVGLNPKKVRSNSTKCAEFKAGTTIDGNESIIYATKVGWVNKRVILGVLKEVNKEQNRVVFEFHDDNKIYNAWSSNKWAKENMKKFKPGYHYTVEGTVLIKTRSQKFFRSTNSTFQYDVLLAGMNKVVKTKVKKPRDKSVPVKEIKQKVDNKQSCNQTVEDVTLVSGDLRRYMGCEVCHAGLSKPGLNGNFYCQQTCKDKRKRDRMVCIVVTNMKIKDNHGNQLENIVCYHKECEKLFGSKVFQQVCSESSDLKAKKRLSKILGSVIDSARIKHQKPTGSQTKAFNDWKLVVEKIMIKTHDDSDDAETGSNSNKPTVLTTAISKSNGNSCPCVLEEEDDDDTVVVASTTLTPEPSNSNSSSNQDIGFVLDSSGQYDLFPANDGYIGLALLINISFVPDKKYPGPCSDIRNGSENDVETLMELLPSIRIRIFKNEPFRNINKEEFQTIMREFKEELIRKEYSCMFFIIMSHGILFNIRLRDMSRINVYKDILSEFSDKKFHQFCGKPKVCILNACQYFTANDAKEIANMVVDESELYPDMLVCTPCFYGVKAKRHVKKGSYFIQELAKVLKEKWKSMHLEAIMKEVQQNMSLMRFGPNKTATNVPLYEPMLFNKPFYFPNTVDNSTDRRSIDYDDILH